MPLNHFPLPFLSSLLSLAVVVPLYIYTTVVAVTFIVQLTAAGMCLRLVQKYGRWWALALVALVMLMLAVRPFLASGYHLFPDRSVAALFFETAFLVLSVLLMLALWYGVPWFLDRVEASARVEQEYRKVRKEARQQMRRLYDNVPLGLYRTNANGQLLDANPMLARMLATPQSLSPALPSGENGSVEADRQLQLPGMAPFAAMTAGKTTDGGTEVKLQRPDGSAMWVRNASKPVTDKDGNVLYYEGSLQDITETRQLQEQLSRARSQLSALLETSPVGQFRIDPSGQFVEGNAHVLRALGYADEAALRRASITDRFARADDRTAWKERLGRDGRVDGLRIQVDHTDGSTRTLEISAKAVRDEDDKLLHYQGAMQDVTDEVTMRRALDDLQAELERLRNEEIVAYEKRLAEQTEQSAGQLDQLREKLTAERAAAEAEYTTLLEQAEGESKDLRRQLEEKVQQLTERHRGETDALAGEHREQADRLRERLDEYRGKVEQLEDQLRKAEADHAQQVDALHKRHAEAVGKTEEALRKANETERRHERAIAELEQSHKAELARLRDEVEEAERHRRNEIQALQREHATQEAERQGQVDTLKARLDEAAVEREQALAEAKARWHEASREEIARLRKKSEDQQQAHAAELAGAKSDHEEAFNELKRQYRITLADIRRENEGAQAELKDRRAKDLEELEARRREELEQLTARQQARLDKLTAEHESAIRALNAAQARTEVGLRGQIDHLQKELTSREDELDERRKGNAAAVEALKKSLEEQRMRAESIEAQLNDTRVELGRLRRDAAAQQQSSAAALRRSGIVVEALQQVTESLQASGGQPPAFDDALKALGRAAGADRVLLFENGVDDSGDVTASLGAEWCGPEAVSLSSRPELVNLSYHQAGLGRWIERMVQGRPIEGAVKELPDHEQPLLHSLDLQVILALPVTIGDRWWGMLIVERGGGAFDAVDAQLLKGAVSAIALAVGRQEAVDTLSDSESRFRDLLEVLPEVSVVGCAPDGTILHVNEAAERLYGRVADVVVGENLFDVLLPDDLHDAVRQEMDRCLESDHVAEPSDSRRLCRDGTSVAVRGRCAVVYRDDGRPELFFMDVPVGG